MSKLLRRGCSRSTADCSQRPVLRTTRVWSEPSRTGSVGAASTRVRQRSCRRRRSICTHRSTICARSPATTGCRRSFKPPSRTPSSKPSTHSSTGTAVLSACRRAVDDAAAFEERVEQIEQRWRAALGRVRARSAVELLLAALPGAPIVSVGSAADLIGRSFQATNEAMHRLEVAGVVRRIRVARRNRAYEAPAIIDAFTALERQLASPVGDTRAASPRRPTPARA